MAHELLLRHAEESDNKVRANTVKIQAETDTDIVEGAPAEPVQPSTSSNLSHNMSSNMPTAIWTGELKLTKIR